MPLTARASAPAQSDSPEHNNSSSDTRRSDGVHLVVADVVADEPSVESGSGSEWPAPEPDADEPKEFTIRPGYALHGFVATGAGMLVIGFGFAASRTDGIGEIWRWVVAAGFALLAVLAIRALLAKPLLVADDTGIRLRIRSKWIGAPWEQIESVTVLPRRHLLDDGRIAVNLADPGPVLETMDKATRRLTDANRRLTGSSLAVPFGLAAVPSDPDVVTALATIARNRCPLTQQL